MCEAPDPRLARAEANRIAALARLQLMKRNRDGSPAHMSPPMSAERSRFWPEAQLPASAMPSALPSVPRADGFLMKAEGAAPAVAALGTPAHGGGARVPPPGCGAACAPRVPPAPPRAGGAGCGPGAVVPIEVPEARGAHALPASVPRSALASPAPDAPARASAAGAAGGAAGMSAAAAALLSGATVAAKVSAAADSGSASARGSRMGSGGAGSRDESRAAAAAGGAARTRARPPHPFVDARDVDAEGCIMVGESRVLLADAHGHRPGDGGYDPYRLALPSAVLKSLSAAMRQYWTIKAEHLDLVLLVKIGKFYEAFDLDAALMNRELGFQFKSGGKHLCTGCPEGRIGDTEAALVGRGFRTGVVEQLESTDDAAGRGTPAVVPRALRSISTPGSAGTAGDPIIAVVCASGRAVCCILYSPLTHALRVAVASEAAGGSATIATHLAVARPVELVLEAVDDDVAAATAGVVSRLHARNVVRQRWVDADLRACFGDASGAAITGAGPLAARAAQLLQAYYISLLKGPRGLDGVSVSIINGRGGGGASSFMELNEATLSNLDVFELASDALSYDRAAAAAGGGGARAPEGTLLGWIDTTGTASGRRLLREWLARPLLSVQMIRERQTAVTDLIRGRASGVTAKLRSLIGETAKHPDIETCLGRAQRLLLRVNALAGVSLCDTVSIVRPALTCLCDIIESASAMAEIPVSESVAELRDASTSRLLYRLLSFGSVVDESDAGSGGCWPHQHSFNSSLVAAVDVPGARKWLTLGSANGGSEAVARLLRPGADSGADAAAAAVESTRREISAYIRNTVASCAGLRGGAEVWMSKNVVIELPKGSDTASRLPHEATIVSQTAKAVRVTTAALQALWCAHLEAEERNQKSNGAAVVALLSVAMTYCETLRRGARCVAVLDCLLALATRSDDDAMCVPTIIPSPDATVTGAIPVLELFECVHPIASSIAAKRGCPFVANDIVLGGDAASFTVVTGPNMGGKSTLLRQTAMATILAQIGCRVPARTARLSVVDAIFVRVGAADNILHNRSTLAVELDETAVILARATRNSLVIIDELGRGTSTWDGCGIAFAVARALVDLGARTLFATHYRELGVSFRGDARVTSAHMGCIVGGVSDAGSDGAAARAAGSEHASGFFPAPLAPITPAPAPAPHPHSVVFTYRFVPGIAASSFGLNVARLAHLPPEVLASAASASEHFAAGCTVRAVTVPSHAVPCTERAIPGFATAMTSLLCNRFMRGELEWSGVLSAHARATDFVAKSGARG